MVYLPHSHKHLGRHTHICPVSNRTTRIKHPGYSQPDSRLECSRPQHAQTTGHRCASTITERKEKLDQKQKNEHPRKAVKEEEEMNLLGVLCCCCCCCCLSNSQWMSSFSPRPTEVVPFLPFPLCFTCCRSDFFLGPVQVFLLIS